MDFPGYDNAQRHDWDGSVEADAAAPWVPAGRSGWELSVRKDPRGKAESDYQSRVSSLTPVERAKCTFVFVTARNWSGKNTWAGNKENSGGLEGGTGVRRERSGAVAGDSGRTANLAGPRAGYTHYRVPDHRGVLGPMGGGE